MVICPILLLLLISIATTTTAASQSSANKTIDAPEDCSAQSNQSTTTLRVVVLFDITPEYATNFRTQQHRLIKTLRHIDQQAKGRPRFYALVAFHRTSVVLSGLNAAQAKNVEKVIGQINGLNPRRRLETTPSKAFETAAELLEYHQNSTISSGTTNIVLFVHDGLNTDTRNETFEAISKLSKHEAAIFAITGNVKPNEEILTEYTASSRGQLFANNDDMENFFQALDNKIDPCASVKAPFLKKKFPAKLRDDKKSSGVAQEALLIADNESESQTNSEQISQKLEQQQQFVKREQSSNFECSNVGKIDLMLLLDTSGSIYHSFPQQRQLALQMLHIIEPALDALQVGIIQFAHEPTVIHSLREPTATKYREMVEKVRDLVFTGRNTRIADALELGLNELDKYGRKDAQKVLILISDGHGQEFWHRAAEVAHRLETTHGLQRFAVSSSLDYNLEELVLYMGDSRRVFVGQRVFVFMPTIVAFLNKCLPNRPKKLGSAPINLADNNGTTTILDGGGGGGGVAPEQPHQQVSSSSASAAAAVVDGDAGESSTVDIATTTVDEFSTVANLSQMLRAEADNDDNALAADERQQRNRTASSPPISAGLAEETLVSNSSSSLAQHNAKEDGLRRITVGKREKAEKNNNVLLVADNERDQPMKAEVEDMKNNVDHHHVDDDDRKVPKTGREAEETLRKVVPKKQSPSKMDEGCDTDVLIMLDRARPDQAFEQQVALAKHLVAKIEPDQIASGTTRVSIISFGDQAKREVGWRDKLARRQILQRLDAIQRFNSQTSFLQAAKMAVEENSKNRRPEARMLAAVFWSGLDGRDNADELSNALNQFSTINRTQLFAVSLNPKANLTRLKELAGDHWHVFVEGRASQFTVEVSHYLLDCVLPPSGAALHHPTNPNAGPALVDSHEPLSSVERVEHLQAAARAFQQQPFGNCKDDLVDLALLLHFRPQNATSPNELAGQFRAMRRAAMDALRQAPPDHYQKRIRLSLLINARVQVSLKTAIDQDDALFAIDRAQLDQAELDGNVPLANKLQMSIDDLRQFHREGARVVILVLSNDEQQPQRLDNAAEQQQSRLIIKGLDRLSASLFLLNFAPPGARPSDGTLSARFNGSDTERDIRVFSTSGKISHFVDAFRRKTFMCKDPKERVESALEQQQLIASDTAPLSPSKDSKPIIASSSSLDDDGPTAAAGNETVGTSSGAAVQLLENGQAELLLDNTDKNNRNSSSDNATEKATVIQRAANALDAPIISSEQIAPALDGSPNVTVVDDEISSGNGTTTRSAADNKASGTTVITTAIPTTVTTTSAHTTLPLNNNNNNNDATTTATTLAQSDEHHSHAAVTGSTTVSSRTTTTVVVAKQQQQQQHMRKPTKFAWKKDDDHPRVFLLGDECKVDLMFIIDTSQSVQEAFDEQLQFAVDLVKRLPDQDFAQRVQVGAVSFQKTAKVQFALGELKEKPAILEALLHINHTGGGTSVVSGVNLAMDEVAKHKRNGTRLMVVLISDGSSQDPWGDVLHSADRLRAAEADVYAVTVSHDYFFRELELYAGNKWFVYIDARIRQFLDEAEMSLVECKSPSMPMLRGVRRDDGNGTAPPPNTSVVVAANDDDMVLQLNNMTTTTNDDASQQLLTTNASSSVELEEAAAAAGGGTCEKDPVDLMFIIDTSTSVQKEFYAEKNFALDLVRVLPEQDFAKRISIAMVKFRGTADIHFHFQPGRRREDIIYDIERVQHTGGETSLATAAELAFREIFRLRRPEARLIVVIITDGNSQDEWKNVKVAAKKLRDATGGKGVYAVTLSEKYSVEELREYTGTDNNLYLNNRIDQFIQEVGNLISRCPDGRRDGVKVTPVPDVEASITPSSTPIPIEQMNATTISGGDQLRAQKNSTHAKDGHLKKPNKEDEVAKARDENPIRASREEELFDETKGAELLSSKCKSSKIDLIIILDASTSRENVFEHQRELALSLIERLPISREGTPVSTGIISFTNSAVLRQNLGLGRDRKTVRKTIEDIKYRGGSTLTSKAVELALQDMRRGMRPDARQVIVLMNDGMSQDPWEQVLESSRNLANSGAERFGVALGTEVDLRELNLYIGNSDRIYRDGSTERFLRDIVALLGVSMDNDCPPPAISNNNNNARVKAVPIHRKEMDKMPTSDLLETHQLEFQLDSHCEKPNVDLLIMLDNLIGSEGSNDNLLKLNSNRYLLLDVLGSIPSDGRLRVALISAGGPRLEYRLEDPQDHDVVVTRVERVRPLKGAPDYAAGIARALDHYASARRDDARGILLLAGTGNGTSESPARRQIVANRIRQTQGLICIAVDSGKDVDVQTLLEYTGSPQLIFPFEKNAEFAKLLFDDVTASDQCQTDQDKIVPRAFSEIGTELSSERQNNNNNNNITEKNSGSRPRLRDLGLIRLDKETFGNDKLIGKQSDQKTDDLLSLLLLSTLRPVAAATSFSPSNMASQSSAEEKITTTAHQQPPFRNTTSATRALTTTTTPQNDLNKFDRIAPVQNSLKKDERRRSSSSSPTSTTTTTTLPTTTLKSSEGPLHAACLIDLLLIIDASGSVHAAFEQEKMLAAQIIQQIRVGPNNARVAIVKFASAGKVRTLHAFDAVQHNQTVLDVLSNMTFSDGTTAIHSALQQAVHAYSAQRGARPGVAEPIAVVLTDGFGQHEFGEQATQLRGLVPRVYAVAVHDGVGAPIARAELAKLTGDPRRVFTAATLPSLYAELRERFSGC